jgi:hypothetical protein
MSQRMIATLEPEPKTEAQEEFGNRCVVCGVGWAIAKESAGCLCNPWSDLHQKMTGENKTMTETMTAAAQKKQLEALIKQEMEKNCPTCGMGAWYSIDSCNCKFASESFQIAIKLSVFESKAYEFEVKPVFVSCSACHCNAELAKANDGCNCVPDSLLNVDRPFVDVDKLSADVAVATVTPTEGGTLITTEKKNDGITIITNEPIDPVELETEEEIAARLEKIKKDAKDRNTLMEMHEYMRPAFSKWDNKFVGRFIKPVNPIFDACGNAIVDIGENPTVIWSSHTDTVHSHQGKQALTITENHILKLAKDEKSNCLGADDTVGVWIMLEMIKAGVAGRYIFHRGEEKGCIGSNWILKNRPKTLEGIQMAIAFDRRGTTDVINRQRGSECCSWAFADSLCDELNKTGMKFKQTSGVYTDTAVYIDKIPECTNISVGYEGAHGSHESTNLDFALDLRDIMLTLDVSKLKVKRDPNSKVYSYSGRSYHGGGHYGGYQGGSPYGRTEWDEDYMGRAAGEGYGQYRGSSASSYVRQPDASRGVTRVHHKAKKSKKKGGNKSAKAQTGFVTFQEQADDRSGVVKVASSAKLDWFVIRRIAQDYPDMVADYIEANGGSAKEILHHIRDTHGEHSFNNVAKRYNIEVEEPQQEEPTEFNPWDFFC